jgi:pectate lyase
MGAQVLVQSSSFSNTPIAITSRDSKEVGYVNLVVPGLRRFPSTNKLNSYASVFDVNLGGGANEAPQGNLNANSVPYSYSLLGASSVASTVPKQAGANLSF